MEEETIKPAGAAPERHVEKGLFHGRSIVVEQVAGAWKRSLLGDPPTPKQQKQLQQDWEFLDLVPEGRIRLGESWILSGPLLRRFVGFEDALSFEGTMRFTLDRIVEFGGERCALIQAHLQVRFRTLDDENQPIAVEMTCTGNIHRSLVSFLDVSAQLRGQLHAQGKT